MATKKLIPKKSHRIKRFKTKVPETKALNATVLRKIRDKVISLLQAKKISTPNHYKISAVNETAPTFIVSLIRNSAKSTTLKNSSHVSQVNVMNTLKGYKPFKDISEKLVNTGNSKEESYRIDFSTAYEILLSELPASKVQKTLKDTEIKAEVEVGVRRGRRKGGKAILQEEIQNLLSNHTNLKIGTEALGYVFVTTADQYKVSIRCRSEFAYMAALSCLESGYAKHIKIENRAKFLFSVHTDEARINKTLSLKREKMLDFFIYLKQAIKSIDSVSKVLNSYLDYAEFGTILEIQVSEPGFIPRIEKSFPPYVKCFKEGTLLKMKISPADIDVLVEKKEIVVAKNPVNKGLLTTTASPSNTSGARYVHSSTNYDEFHFLPFNRKTNNRHITDLVESIKLFGVLTFVIVVETDCVDGIMKKWVVDGQHRFKAYKYEGLPILYTKANASTKEELVRLIAKLNHTSQNWSLKNYLDAWTSLKIPEYLQLQKLHTTTKVPFTLMLQIFENETNKKTVQERFCDGKFKMKNEQRARQTISYLSDTQTILPKNRDLFVGHWGLIKKHGVNYDHAKFMRNLKKVSKNLPFAQGDEVAVVLKKFERIYSSAA